MTPSLHLWLIPVLPLIGAAINGLLGRRFSRQTVAAIALAFLRRGVRLAFWFVCARFSSARHCRTTNSSRTGSAPATSGELRVLSRSAHAGHAAGRDRRRLPDPYLFGRLHVGGRRLLPLLHLPEPVHVLHAHAGAGRQLSADVHRLGRRGPRVLSADRFLVHQRFGRLRRKESIHRQPHRRLRLPDRAVPADQAFRLAGFRPGLSAVAAAARGDRRRRPADFHRPAA